MTPLDNIQRTVIDYFFLQRTDGRRDQVIYHDRTGQRREKWIDRSKVEEALRHFDGQPRAVVRSGGGITLATPCQLVISDVVNEKLSEPQLRIKVRFRELKRNKRREVISEVPMMGSKIVSPDEIYPAFPFELEGQQRFVADFGRGIVPVYVFHYTVDYLGNAVALFTEMDAVERSVMAGLDRTIKVQAYQIPQEALRYALPSNRLARDEFDVAFENYRLQKEAGFEPFPTALKIGPELHEPSNLTYDDFRNLILQSLLELNLQKLDLTAENEFTRSREIDRSIIASGIYDVA